MRPAARWRWPRWGPTCWCWAATAPRARASGPWAPARRGWPSRHPAPWSWPTPTPRWGTCGGAVAPRRCGVRAGAPADRQPAGHTGFAAAPPKGFSTRHCPAPLPSAPPAQTLADAYPGNKGGGVVSHRCQEKQVRETKIVGLRGPRMMPDRTSAALTFFYAPPARASPCALCGVPPLPPPFSLFLPATTPAPAAPWWALATAAVPLPAGAARGAAPQRAGHPGHDAAPQPLGRPPGAGAPQPPADARPGDGRRGPAQPRRRGRRPQPGVRSAWLSIESRPTSCLTSNKCGGGGLFS